MGNKKLIQFDWAIKSILRQKQNFKILEGFLSELLKKDIKIISILESESNVQNADDKQNRVDLLVKTNKGEHIIIEVQAQNQPDYLSRVLFATSKAVVENIRKGDKYSVIPKVISVSILYFYIFEGDNFLHVVSSTVVGYPNKTFSKLKERVRKQYAVVDDNSDIFPTHYVIEVQKFKGEIRESFDEWVYFLKTEEIIGDPSAKGLKEANTELDYLKLSAKDKRDYDAHLESKSLHAQYMEKVKTKSFNEGESQGIAKGIALEKVNTEKEIEKKVADSNREVAKGLINYGLDLDAISEITGIDLSELEKLEETEV